MRLKDVRGEIRWISNGSTRRVMEKLLDLLEAAEIDGIIALREMEAEQLQHFQPTTPVDPEHQDKLTALAKDDECYMSALPDDHETEDEGVKEDAEEKGSTEQAIPASAEKARIW